MPYRLDRGLRAELLPQPSDAHVHHVGARDRSGSPTRPRAVAPGSRPRPGGRRDGGASGTRGRSSSATQLAQPYLRDGQGRGQLPRPQDAAVLAAASPATQLGSYAREQLVEREWLRDVVRGAEAEAPELRRGDPTAPRRSPRAARGACAGAGAGHSRPPSFGSKRSRTTRSYRSASARVSPAGPVACPRPRGNPSALQPTR